uniref:Uncharacterized protein n=1 Tax=Anguilla anguilla TaxID=7936 RepID=A0A0E9XP42_ANGAN
MSLYHLYWRWLKCIPVEELLHQFTF